MPAKRHRHPKPPRHLIEVEETLNPDGSTSKAYFAMAGDYTWNLHPTRGWRSKRTDYSDRVTLPQNDMLQWFRELCYRKGFV